MKERIVKLYNYSMPQIRKIEDRQRMRTQNPKNYLDSLKDSFIELMYKNNWINELEEFLEIEK